MTGIQPHPGLVGGPIYLDYNATTPVDPRVVDATLPYLRTHFGNPSSAHHYGTQAGRALQHARGQLAELIGGEPEEITFTGSGSEANALAIRGVALARLSSGAQIITQQTEHPAVLETVAALKRLHGVDVVYLPVDQYGQVRPETLAEAVSARTVLVSIMYANNETGTLQPIRELAEIAHRHRALFHTDAAQALGKIPVDVRQLGIDLLTIVGHKMYAPKGIGALWTRTGIQLEPVAYGGGQEHGLRAGTENVALSVALGAAAGLAAEDLAAGQPDRLRALRDQLHHQLANLLPGRVHLNGHPAHRLPNTVNLSITGIDGAQLLAAVPDVAASTGSACHTDPRQPSPALSAAARDHARPAEGASPIRLSLGRWTTADDVTRGVRLLADAVTGS